MDTSDQSLTGSAEADRRDASREASGWLVRLQEAPDDGDLRRRFEAWLAEPGNVAAWDETQRMARAVAAARPGHAANWGPHLDRVRRAAADDPRNRRPARPLHRRRVLRLAGVAAAACVAALAVAPDVALHLRSDWTTGTAESRSLRLSDDSVVTVAPGSAVSFTDGAGERVLRLFDGEVYLEVTPDAGRPFRVLAADAEVTVVGTAFNVSRTDAGTEVAVAQGVVRVARPGGDGAAAETLRAGELLRAGPSGGMRRGAQPVSQVGAWRRNQLIAQDQPLGGVVDRLRRYHAGAIVVAGGDLAAQPVTGVYDLGNPEAALRAIARSQDAVVRRFTPWLLVLSPF